MIAELVLVVPAAEATVSGGGHPREGLIGREGPKRSRGATEQAEAVVAGEDERAVRAADRADPRPEDVHRPRGRRVRGPGRGQRHPPAQRVDAEGQQMAAVADVGAQGGGQRRRHPALVAGEDHAGVSGQPRPDPEGETEIGGQLIAEVVALQVGEQRDLLTPARGQAVDQRSREQHRIAAAERVGDAVPVVVDRVERLPGERRQHDEHPAPSAAAGAPTAGPASGGRRSAVRADRGPLPAARDGSATCSPIAREPRRRRSPCRRPPVAAPRRSRAGAHRRTPSRWPRRATGVSGGSPAR